MTKSEARNIDPSVTVTPPAMVVQPVAIYR
jgi:hypothetical protein